MSSVGEYNWEGRRVVGLGYLVMHAISYINRRIRIWVQGKCGGNYVFEGRAKLSRHYCPCHGQ